MANYTEETQIPARRFVTISSRYSSKPVLYYTENKYLTFPVYKKTPIPISTADKYFVVNAGTEYRPDLISQIAYGTVDFWWRILEANNIKDVYDLKAGLNIRIPPAGLA